VPLLRYDRELILRVLARIVLSAILGFFVTEGLYILDKLQPYSTIRDSITDMLTFPGTAVARLLYFVGSQTGSGTPDWWWAFFVGNTFFYAVLCFIVLDVLNLPPEFSEL
jgi:hypothetical protein